MTGQGEGGVVLGEEARRMIETVLVANTEFEAEAADALAELLPLAAALIAQARADGAAEERGRLIGWLATLADLRADADPLPSGSDGRGLAVDLRWAADRLRREDAS